jgi:hypothetical protein
MSLQANGIGVKANWIAHAGSHSWSPLFAGACVACILSAAPAQSAMRDKLPPPSNDPGRCRYASASTCFLVVVAADHLHTQLPSARYICLLPTDHYAFHFKNLGCREGTAIPALVGVQDRVVTVIHHTAQTELSNEVAGVVKLVLLQLGGP